jgi:hypothetical protein
VLVRELNGPLAGARANIDDVADGGGKGRDVERAVEGQPPHVVLDVEAGDLDVIVREVVGAFVEGMVAAAVLVAVGLDGGVEGGCYGGVVGGGWGRGGGGGRVGVWVEGLGE